MKIVLVNNEQKYINIGNTEQGTCIPRVGEHINLGYIPYEEVNDVLYDFNSSTIYVLLDEGIFINEEN